MTGQGIRRCEDISDGAGGTVAGNQTHKEQANILIARGPGTVKSNTEAEDEWKEAELAVDSGATETVMVVDALPGIDTVEGPAAKRVVEYEIANGEMIPNLGEKKFLAMLENNVLRKMTAQVADVNKGLLAVRQVMRNGNRVVFDDEGSYIEDKFSGEWIPVREDEGGLFKLRLWVRKAGFWRQEFKMR